MDRGEKKKKKECEVRTVPCNHTAMLHELSKKNKGFAVHSLHLKHLLSISYSSNLSMEAPVSSFFSFQKFPV